jgi:hypothetical protein
MIMQFASNYYALLIYLHTVHWQNFCIGVPIMTLIPPRNPQTGAGAFDLGAPPAELPQGSSNLPAFDAMPEMQTREVDVMQEPNEFWLTHIKGYPPDQQKLMLAWWPRAWNRPSPYLPRNSPVLTLPGLLIHIEGASKDEARSQRGQKKEQRGAFASAYVAWQKQCVLRLQWIEAKKQEWDRRVKLAKAAHAQWEAFVAEARDEFKAAKAVPPPTRPSEAGVGQTREPNDYSEGELQAMRESGVQF